MRITIAAAIVALTTTSAALAKPSEAETLARMMRGESAMQGEELERAVRKAEGTPLGSATNPVRVAMPAGERAYLARLRCSDGAAPDFARRGNTGTGPFGNIVDLYVLSCAGGTPAASEVSMDMYHAGFTETRAVPGFSLAE